MPNTIENERIKVDLHDMNCPSYAITKIVAISEPLLKAIVFVLYWISVVISIGLVYGIDLLANKKNYDEIKALKAASTREGSRPVSIVSTTSESVPVEDKLDSNIFGSAEKMISYMQSVVAARKDLAESEEVQLCKSANFLGDQFTLGKVLPNLYVGAKICMDGIVDFQSTQNHERMGLPLTDEQVGFINTYKGYFDASRTPDQEKKIASFMEEKSFIPYASVPGGGIFGLVYSTNGGAFSFIEKPFNSNEPSTTARLYLKPEYTQEFPIVLEKGKRLGIQQDTSMKKHPRLIDAELDFNFDRAGGSNKTNIQHVFASFDRAAQFLIEQEGSENPEMMVVHCSQGMERSVTTVIAIILRVLQIKGKEISKEDIELVVKFVQTQRPYATLFNDYFKEFLVKYPESKTVKSVHQMFTLIMEYFLHPSKLTDLGPAGGGGAKTD